MALGHKTLASFYLQLAQNLDAGMPLATALRGASGPPAGDLSKMAAWIEGGGSIEQALERGRLWLPPAERPLLLAAAMAGRLPHVLRRLAERHSQLHAIKQKVMLACAYPLILLHLGILILPVVIVLIADPPQALSVTHYVTTVGGCLFPLWGLIIVVAVLHRRENSVLYQLTGWVPLVRGYCRSQALADFTFTLSNLLDAGIVIAQAWSIAGQATRSPALRAASQKIHASANLGEPPGVNLPRFSCFPVAYVGLYRAGELNGQLDPNLRLLVEQSHDHSNLCLKLAARAYSALVFLLIAGMVGCLAYATFAGYFRILTKISRA